MSRSDSEPSFAQCVDQSATPEPVSPLRQAQRELERANRALKQAVAVQAAASAAAHAAAMVEAEVYRTLSLAECRIKDCQKRVYELS